MSRYQTDPEYRERKKGYARRSYHRNKEKRLEAVRKYRDKNRDKIRGHNREYYEAHREAILAYDKKRKGPRKIYSKVIRCNNCGMEFKKYLSRIGEYNFCGRECYEKYVKETGYKGGSNSPLWSGGPKHYGGGFTTQLKKEIRDRDGHTCQICGIHESMFSDVLCVHHIDYNKHHNSPHNLVALCRSCHGKTNGDEKVRNNWGEYFAGKEKYTA